MKDIYCVFKSGDIKGETRDAKHATEYGIEIEAFEHLITQPKSAGSSSSGGHTAERTEHGEMTFTKEVDAATTKLCQASSAGTVYKDVEIHFYRALGGQNATATSTKRVKYLQINLKNVVVSTVGLHIGSDSKKELPTETFGLRYSAVEWIYNEAPLDGGTPKYTNIKGSWNLKTNDIAFAG